VVQYQYASPALKTTSCQSVSQAVRAINCPYDSKQSVIVSFRLKAVAFCFSETSVFTSQAARCHGDANSESDIKLEQESALCGSSRRKWYWYVDKPLHMRNEAVKNWQTHTANHKKFLLVSSIHATCFGLSYWPSSGIKYMIFKTQNKITRTYCICWRN
jgi:hypothetical protein